MSVGELGMLDCEGLVCVMMLVQLAGAVCMPIQHQPERQATCQYIWSRSLASLSIDVPDAVFKGKIPDHMQSYTVSGFLNTFRINHKL